MMTAAAIAVLISWMMVSVTAKLPFEAKTTGVESIGGSQ